MPLQKQPVDINFAKGLDTKTDPFRVSVGNFLTLENSVFGKGGSLDKRNGFDALPALPDALSTYVTTFNGNLTAVGPHLYAYSMGSKTWVNKGSIQPAEISTLPALRSNTNQDQVDSALAANGLLCVVFTDEVPVSGSPVKQYKYVVIDSVTGQNIVAPALITVTSGAVVGSPRVFYLGTYFVIVFTNLITATNHLQYIAINSITPTQITANTDISAQYTPANTVAFDGFVANNSLYLAWNGSDVGGAIRVAALDSTLVLHTAKVYSGYTATLVSVTADLTASSTPIIYVTFYDSATSNGYTLAAVASAGSNLTTVLNPTQTITSEVVVNLTSTAVAGVCRIFYEVTTTYSYNSVATNIIKRKSCTQAGVVGSANVTARSVGLASKAFLIGTTSYFLTIYSSTFQPTYFLMNFSGQVAVKLAYSNGGSYYTRGLPGVSVNGAAVKIAYFYKDLVQAANKSQGVASAAGVYSQLGINIASMLIGSEDIVSSEIGNDLFFTGGISWMYDGYSPVENGFHLYPDNVLPVASTTGGTMTAQQYYYQVTYEWSDNQGNVFRSAPSLPVTVTTTGTTSSVTVNVPTLRLTYKIANPVKIVVYRWSAGQQTYYQATSIVNPILNDPTVDSVAFVDTQPDTAIIGNNILYTTGGVIENIGPPAAKSMTLFDNRLWLIDSEDRNLLWYSKQVIEATPVEMSDLLTIYVAPNSGAQGSTGDTEALAPMDDKLIIFKKDAIYYINGRGPDNTGANSQYSDPVFITAVVGSENQHSIVFIPSGLMFQSDKGIWLLGRDLSTQYIGAPVERLTKDATVLSSVNVPGTNQVRFTLDSGVTLMYDYYYGQWGTFTNIPAISATLYEGLHTYIDSVGKVFQESASGYLDGSNPVLMSFTTGWINLAGLQGYERAYFFYLLGVYLSPHKLSLEIAFDYGPVSQSVLITPRNYNPAYGSDALYGSGSPYGGPGNLEQWRVFFTTQKCQAFQIKLTEIYDPSKGAIAGAGISLSGLNLVVGAKKGYTTIRSARSTS